LFRTPPVENSALPAEVSKVTSCVPALLCCPPRPNDELAVAIIAMPFWNICWSPEMLPLMAIDPGVVVRSGLTPPTSRAVEMTPGIVAAAML
jgi:hypothetical protein